MCADLRILVSEDKLMTSQKRILAVFAHPDDETFGAGSTLARYVSEGVDITVVCATRGEAGEIAPGSDATSENLGDIREAELRSALKILGVPSLILLGYRDSGMVGSEDNRESRSVYQCANSGSCEPSGRTHTRVPPSCCRHYGSEGRIWSS